MGWKKSQHKRANAVLEECTQKACSELVEEGIIRDYWNISAVAQHLPLSVALNYSLDKPYSETIDEERISARIRVPSIKLDGPLDSKTSKTLIEIIKKRIRKSAFYNRIGFIQAWKQWRRRGVLNRLGPLNKPESNISSDKLTIILSKREDEFIERTDDLIFHVGTYGLNKIEIKPNRTEKQRETELRSIISRWCALWRPFGYYGMGSLLFPTLRLIAQGRFSEAENYLREREEEGKLQNLYATIARELGLLQGQSRYTDSMFSLFSKVDKLDEEDYERRSAENERLLAERKAQMDDLVNKVIELRRGAKRDVDLEKRLKMSSSLGSIDWEIEHRPKGRQ